MSRKYSVAFFGFIILLVIIIYLNNISYEKENIIEPYISPDEITDDILATDSSVKNVYINKDCYYLCEVNGYIVVYKSDKKTPYEYTDILYKELPELLKKEIKNGKYIKDEKELYGFLENYSS